MTRTDTSRLTTAMHCRRLPGAARLLVAGALASALSWLGGCASLRDPGSPSDATAGHTPIEAFGVQWREQRLPTKAATVYRAEQRQGREAIAASAQASASLLRRHVRVEPADLGQLRLSWLVERLIADADMASRELDDSPVRVVLAFDGDRSRFSPRDAAASELSQLLTGEPLPYATLMYVWCNKRPAGTVIEGPRTTRIRKIVLESGPQGLGRWQDYERDVRADYERAFGEPAGALVGVALMTDTDNTRSRARAWYGALQWLPPKAGGTR